MLTARFDQCVQMEVPMEEKQQNDPKTADDDLSNRGQDRRNPVQHFIAPPKSHVDWSKRGTWVEQ